MRGNAWPLPLEVALARPSPKQQFLSIEEAAEFLNMTVRWMRRQVDQRRIPFHKFGNRLSLGPRSLCAEEPPGGSVVNVSSTHTEGR